MRQSHFLSHLALAIIVSFLCGLIYVSVQQTHRSIANDPQLEIARDIKISIQKNHSIEKWMTDDSIDISNSLAIFKCLYHANGEPVQSTALLDGSLPRLPKGVFDFTKNNEEDVFTWQPRRGIRMAMVVEHVQSPQVGFVAVGRSLNETENRISNLITMLLIGWLACLGVIGLHWIFIIIKNRK